MQERIQKILAHGGIASRRAAEQLIKSGRVRVNGKVITELGVKANPRFDTVEVDGKRVVAEQHVYVVLHKPRGVVSTMSDPEGRPSVAELLGSLSGRLYPVGRLDFATSGVLIITNDGELHDGLLHPRKAVPKTYVLKVKGVMGPEDIEHWRKGIQLEDGITLPAQAKLIRHEADKTWLELTIREGRNQQIRRMGEATGFPVMRLARLAFAEVTAEGLAPGRWRHLTREELTDLKKEYGVPKSLPAAPAEDEKPTRGIQAKAVHVRGPLKGAAGRATRNFGGEARSSGGGEAREPREENWGTRSSGGGPSAGRGRGESAGGERGAARWRSADERSGAGAAGAGARGRGAGGRGRTAGSSDDRGGARTRAGSDERGAPARGSAGRSGGGDWGGAAEERAGSGRGRGPGSRSGGAGEERAGRGAGSSDERGAPRGRGAADERGGAPTRGRSAGGDWGSRPGGGAGGADERGGAGRGRSDAGGSTRGGAGRGRDGGGASTGAGPRGRGAGQGRGPAPAGESRGRGPARGRAGESGPPRGGRGR